MFMKIENQILCINNNFIYLLELKQIIDNNIVKKYTHIYKFDLDIFLQFKFQIVGK